MGTRHVAEALERAESVFRRRPGAGTQDDAPATARWEGNTRVVASHANGTEVETDMPSELGGTGDRVSPGWLLRAGIATCYVTSIAFVAAARGIELQALEVTTSSRSDTRGMLGMDDGTGKPVYAGPADVQLHVRIGARGIAPERLRGLVQDSLERSPVPSAVRNATPLALTLEVVPR